MATAVRGRNGWLKGDAICRSGSMVTVATVTFSITMLALSQASSQYSPRLLQRFMSDRPTQIVLGVFVGVFVYCIVVLRTISEGDDREFLPPCQ